ncbi:hypothetical protein IPA_01645 [Ignicoccus pacificus DSM 13166]|uniref:Adenosine deaminase domain-containing protein n=1 Tax=Ignicoccus pacificus DSM 13166 TaxID=940294 RepID=A0A977KCH4_9CREN|nr:hypothetical protein IPA_01645 [Ignicoccus pacificus DSM 13166]
MRMNGVLRLPHFYNNLRDSLKAILIVPINLTKHEHSEEIINEINKCYQGLIRGRGRRLETCRKVVQLSGMKNVVGETKLKKFLADRMLNDPPPFSPLYPLRIDLINSILDYINTEVKKAVGRELYNLNLYDADYSTLFKALTDGIIRNIRGVINVNDVTELIILSRRIPIEHLSWQLSPGFLREVTDEHVHLGASLTPLSAFFHVSYFIYSLPRNIVKKTSKYSSFLSENFFKLLEVLPIARIALEACLERNVPSIFSDNEEVNKKAIREYLETLLSKNVVEEERLLVRDVLLRNKCSIEFLIYELISSSLVSSIVQNDLYTGLSSFSMFYSRGSTAIKAIRKAVKNSIAKNAKRRYVKIIEHFHGTMDEVIGTRLTVRFKISAEDFYKNFKIINNFKRLSSQKYFLSYVKRPFKNERKRALRSLLDDMYKEAYYFKLVLENYENAKKIVLGPDVAGVEEHVPNWIGVRYVSMTTEFMTEKGVPSIISYHAGESYFNVFNGLRSMYEVIEFGGLRSDDRIGHALVLGDTEVMNSYIENAWDALFDLVFIRLFLEREMPHLVNQLEGTFRQVIYKVRREGMEIQPELLMELWKDLFDEERLRYLLFHSSYPALSNGYYYSVVNNFKMREVEEEILEVFKHYFNSWHKTQSVDLIKVLQRSFSEDQIREIATNIREFLMELVKRKGIFIESCPTSNIIIRHLSSHPLGLFKEKELKVGMGTDDPLILNTEPFIEQGIFNKLLEEVDMTR